MDRPFIAIKSLSWIAFLWLALFSVHAVAAVDNVGVLNNVLDKFEAAAAAWTSVVSSKATWLFWLLVAVSMTWTFGLMALRRADIGEFFAEFIRFTMFTGFYWWLLVNGPQFAVDIMRSLRAIGAQASGLPNDLGPSGIVDVGFDIFFKVIDQSSVWAPMESLFGMLLAAVILIVFALVGTNLLLLLVSGYLFAYAGVFILGFGGSKWTSDMAVGYYKSILNIALQLMAMILIVGIGRSFVDQYYTAMSAGITLKELGVMAVVAAVLLFLVAKVPPQIGALAGGPAGNLGSNFGVGAAIGAAAVGAAAVASAGAALAAGATSMAGGAQALMAAASSANASENGNGNGNGGVGMASLVGAAGSAVGDSGEGSSFAAAMGDYGTSTSGSSGAMGARSASSNGDTPPKPPADSSGKSAGSAHQQAKSGSTAAAVGATAAKVGRVTVGTAMNLGRGALDVASSTVSEIGKSASGRIARTTGGKIAAAIKARDAANSLGQGDTQFGESNLSAGDAEVDSESEIAAFRDRDSKSS